jgi:hypothetical protein
LEFASSTISWVFVIKSATCFSHDSNGCMYDEFSLIHHFNSSDDDFIAYAVSKSALLVTKNHERLHIWDIRLRPEEQVRF